MLNLKKKQVVFEEVNGEFVPKNTKASDKRVKLNSAIAITPPLAMLPSYVHAATATDEATKGVFDAVMSIFDTGVVFIIIFAAGAWALGHRNKAIHTLICVASGYILAMNAINIRDFLKSI